MADPETPEHGDDLVGIVSHDLRGLLSTVLMSAQLIERDASAAGMETATATATATPTPTVRAAQRIQRVTRRMTRLLGDLVDLAHIQAGGLTLDLDLGDAAALVTEAVGALGEAASAKRIALTSVRPAAALAARFDHDRALQVLDDLIGNAIHATPTCGEIQVGVERTRGEIHFWVRDTAGGAPEPEAVSARAHHGGTEGRGVGLFISTGIAAAHGGRIWAESPRGGGTTFHFTIPAP